MPARKTSRKSTKRKYGPAAGKSVASAMRRRKRGTLRRSKGGRGGAKERREGPREAEEPREKEQYIPEAKINRPH